MSIKTILLAMIFGLFAAFFLSCSSDNEDLTKTSGGTPSPTLETPTVTPSPTLTGTPPVTLTPDPTPPWPPFTPSPTEPPECEADRQMIQAIVDAYHEETGKWPTSTYEVGKINWIRLIPDWMEERPETVLCTWTINSDPLGQVCRAKHC